nr:hypothetical protein [Neorhizobium tomejilense]
MHFRPSSKARSVPVRAFGFLLEGVFLFIPMACASVVLYDIALNGLTSIFSITVILGLTCWIVFKAVRFATATCDSWVENRIRLRKLR